MKTRVDPAGRSDRRLIFLSLLAGLGLAAVAAAFAPPLQAATETSGRGSGPSAAVRGGTEAAPTGGSSPAVVAAGGPHGGGGSRPPGGAPPGVGSPGGRPPGGGPSHAHHHPGRGYRPPYYSYRPYWNYGIYWGWPYYWGNWGYWGGYPYYPAAVYDGRAANLGALDLDVSPERAQVFLDGQYLGVCDDFDGFPDYLWLEPGTYDLVFFHEGYRTVAHQVTVRAGLRIDFNDRMAPGEAVRPEDLPSKSVERREERLRRDRETAAEARAAAAARDEAWRTRREAEQGEVEAPEAGPDFLDARAEPGRLQLRVVPADASIYLDGRFLGTGEEPARLHSSLLVDAGSHRLQVVRPGFESVEKEFVAVAGEEVELKLELEEE